MIVQPLDLGKIVHYPLSPTNYFREEFPKKQIYLHHTVSHPNPFSNIDYWKSQGIRVATCVVIAGKPYPNEKNYKDGDIVQAFPSKYWALHLASHGSSNQIPAKYKTREWTRELEKASIAIEICNAGWLTYQNGKFYSSFRSIVPEDQVLMYVDKNGYRGQKYYHRYTDAQIESLRLLLHFLCDRYGIPKRYNPDMWDISVRALEGEPGIWTHTSVRSDKSDCHPQPELVRMLMNLEKETVAPRIETAPSPAPVFKEPEAILITPGMVIQESAQPLDMGVSPTITNLETPISLNTDFPTP
ncbi:MAG: N-acetylmuramoyl-L-alanine amidase [Cytophagales bacterium]|nr:N-acetylmuramoyl-L-alanine amidase [Cytophagales bacterium]MDW8384234.1 N-acetylmuramoyl-L-alanine amidase [Flammeovirgaceae bacterium]